MKNNAYRILIIVGLTALTMSIHYGVLPHSHLLHDLHRRLCYVPIILAALWFGLRGGALTAAGISLLLVPYIVFQWGVIDGTVVNEFIEIFFYNAIGILTGSLIEVQQRARRRQEELSAQLRRAERLSALGEAASALAHEVRNPLGSIKGSAEILTRPGTPEGKKTEFLSVLLKEVERLNTVVESFLRLSRPFPMRLKEVNVNEEVESVINLMRPEAERSGVQVSVECDSQLPPVKMDPDRMRQVFMNGMINALQAMPGGGSLTVKTGPARNSTSSRNGSEGVSVSFTDTGVGILPADLPKIFTPFFTTKDEGTGLGLAVSRRIVEEHGGRILIESTFGKGTKLSIVLPVEQRGGER